jgi:hypothetical protein
MADRYVGAEAETLMMDPLQKKQQKTMHNRKILNNLEWPSHAKLHDYKDI